MMTDLTVIMQDSSPRDLLDYIAIFAPPIISIIGTVLSAIAIFLSYKAIHVATNIPKAIAEKQDTIALYKKRLNVYSNIKELVYFRKSLDLEISNVSTQHKKGIVIFMLSKGIPLFNTNDMDAGKYIDLSIDISVHKKMMVMQDINKVVNSLDEVDFLFTISKKDNDNLICLMDSYKKFVTCLITKPSEKDYKERLNMFFDDFSALEVGSFLRKLREQIKLG